MSLEHAALTHMQDAELRLMLRQLPVILWAVDLQLVFTLSEGRGLSQLGLQPGQVVGMSLFEFHQTNDPNHQSVVRHRRAIAGENVNYDFQWQDREYQVRLEPRRSQTGEIIGCSGCALDVTERVSAERRLSRSELQLRTIAENAPAFILVVDPNARIHYINRVQANRQREEILNATINNFIPPHTADEFRAKLAQMFVDHQPFVMESVSEGPDGEQRTYQARIAPFPNEDGLARALVIATDITKTRQAENTIAAQQAKLLHVARLSTMGQMVAAISHEVTQPLAAISNFAAACSFVLSQDPSLDPRLKKYVTSIAEQAERAGSILSGMRQFAKRGEMKRSIGDLADIVNSGVSLIRAELRSRRVTLHMELPADSLQVSVDAVQIQQVLINIIKNACDALDLVPDAPRMIRIECSRQESMAIISVVDSGPGLDEDLIKNLFSPFYTTKPDGMGLGLSICHDILAAHQGTLEARNNPNGGACFRIGLPIIDSSDDARTSLIGTDHLSH